MQNKVFQVLFLNYNYYIENYSEENKIKFEQNFKKFEQNFKKFDCLFVCLLGPGKPGSYLILIKKKN